jgi:large subunit ribosomal protein L30
MALRVTQVKSQIGTRYDHRGTLRALGLGRIGSTATHADTPSIRGMLHQIQYLVQVEEDGGAAAAAPAETPAPAEAEAEAEAPKPSRTRKTAKTGTTETETT